jgi:dipicolinate synthase subunit A
VFDYFEREELAVNNAVPTAQGVIKIAMENMKITLHGARCAVTGYGRTAKVLADMLAALGARVTVAARKCSDLAWARTGGLDAVNISELMKTAPELDLLVNTVPSLVLDCKTLSALRRDCLVIDIASAPYGTDFACARELGLNVIVPGSLPGKTAPKTAGEIIADAILNIIKEGS